jgi:hypothetical protein
MLRDWLSGIRKNLALACAGLVIVAGASRADDGVDPKVKEMADLKAQMAAQAKLISDLKAKVEAAPVAQVNHQVCETKIDDAAIKKVIGDYLKENPGAGMPNGVQTGWDNKKGFYVQSVESPTYVKWDDAASKVPFELNIHGRIQLPFYFYKVTDSKNHLTGVDTHANTSPDFAQLEVKRMRLIFEGHAYDPNLRYHIQFDGNTRGLGGLAGGGVPAGNGTNSSGGVPGVVDGSGVVTVDHAVRLFSCWVGYDFHPCWGEKGCGPECPEGYYKYTPTLTAIMGKLKPMTGLEEYLGSGNQQLIDYSMANWFFDSDDDNLLMCAGFQYKAMDDRFYAISYVTNGNETQIANLQMDDRPGINLGFWYDFGGTWDEANKRWILFGDTLSDLHYSCKPVLRVGADTYMAWQDRRSLFTVAELNRLRSVGAAPGGTSVIGILNGAGFNPNASGLGQFAADAFDNYNYNAFAAFHYKGFSLYNEWWLRNIDNIRGRKGPAGVYPGNGQNQPILYTNNFNGVPAANQTSLFPEGHDLLDFGSTVQGGYFVVPKKLELVARLSWIRGDSGNINGDGTRRALTPAETARFVALGVPAATVATWRVVNGAFNKDQEAQEWAVGFNYFFRGQQFKWSNDISWYNGGNPAAGGQSPAGFIPGVDGWMLRSQIQLAF